MRTPEDRLSIGRLPEPGQLVEVRRRRWIVSAIEGSAMANQHLVTLASIDEDSLGEELQVIWQIEPGARVLERASLPKLTGFDDTERLETFLDAVGWGAVTNADRNFLQAPFRSGIAIEDYQLDPLVRSIDMSRVTLLIADDVGLGKTIEAGLVVQELLVRHRARSVLVVCPASLQIKWKTEMWEKFGLEFRIVDTDYIRGLRRERGVTANPWTSFPRLIVSMDWIKTGEGLRTLRDVLPPHVTYPRRFDVLIVDEAHNVAPSGTGRYAIESLRTKAMRLLSPHFEHRLFLSATPHNGYTESFTSLLELLDDRRFARNVVPDGKTLEKVMVRRLKSDLVDAEGKPLYPRRILKALEIDYDEEELKAHETLRRYTLSRIARSEGTRWAFGETFVLKLLKKRLFSSPRAFATTLRKYADRVLKGVRERRKTVVDEKILHKAIAEAAEEYADEGRHEEALDEAVELASEATVPLDDEEKGMLQELLSWVSIAEGRADSKAEAILSWLENHLKDHGEWNDERVVLFTEYRATQNWLQEILVSHGYGGKRLAILHGGTPSDEREEIKAAFQTDPAISPVRILLATDAASEGIDLQNHCHYLVHVEIPWNPNVMEQRNGRIDRHGQKASEVVVWHPVGKDYERESASGGKFSSLAGDMEFLMRAAMKVNAIREDLGSVGSVVAKQIEEAMLGRRRELDTKRAEEKAEKARRILATERATKERIAKLHAKLVETRRDYHLSPEYVRRAVSLALELAGKPPLEPVSMEGYPEGSLYRVPPLSGSWSKALEGLHHPFTHELRPVTFDYEVAKGREDVVLVHLEHKLVQMSLRLLREELWSPEDVGKLHRADVRAVKGLEEIVAILRSRLVVTGGDFATLHEEIVLSGGYLRENAHARIRTLGTMEEWLDVAVPISPDPVLADILKRRYDRHGEAILRAAEARSKERLEHLHNALDRRRDGEIRDVTKIFDELEETIRRELEEMKKPTQLLFDFAEEERAQFVKDERALERRLKRIPEEKKKEIETIERRYADRRHRTFPVAVTFLVPAEIYEGGGR
ncbi:DISARM system SNF2-like helicase DrmD [Hydrogenimonas urashimensis]|uniref:DISARM system SNF2-like helicase DrmD n=1 Tax=Hydrogenimonas urashimensis TaxID=2740515 RepID=UPI001916B704|nr:DISARM system SNF2-like helicase DrmD [Hydrogenimonas urashimensis]